MTTLFSAAALRMPHAASVAAPAPLALWVPAEPRAPKWCAVPRVELGGITAPAFDGRRGGTNGSDRFGGTARSCVGGSWHRQDWAQIAGGGPLRG
jgi:hypothetical protein